jgi:4-hydroxy-tetrahydrodipicolinate synthase
LSTATATTIAGLKDSSGNWENTATLLKQFPTLSIFPGSERFLLQGLAAGGAGCITATANYDAALIRRVIDCQDGAERDRLNRTDGCNPHEYSNSIRPFLR